MSVELMDPWSALKSVGCSVDQRVISMVAHLVDEMGGLAALMMVDLMAAESVSLKVVCLAEKSDNLWVGLRDCR